MLSYIIDTGRMFIIRTEGQESYLAYRIRNQELDLYSAFVPECQRGRGYASDLILHGIHFAVINGLKVRASCPAVSAYMNRNPEWNYTLSAFEKV